MRKFLLDIDSINNKGLLPFLNIHVEFERCNSFLNVCLLVLSIIIYYVLLDFNAFINK